MKFDFDNKLWIPGWTPILSGAKLLLKNRHLWKYCWLPIAITIVVMLPAIYFFDETFAFFKSFLPDTSPSPPEVTDSKLSTLWSTGWYWFLLALSFLLDIILWFILVLLELIIVYGFLKVVSSPFNDVLSEHVEKISLEESEVRIEAPPILRSLYITCLTEGQRLILLILFFSLFYLCSLLIPGIGAIIFLIASTIYACLWFTYDAMAYSMDRRELKLKPRLIMLLKHPIESLSFGGMIYLILMIPILNFFLIPLFVTGGTLLYLKIDKGVNDKNIITPPNEVENLEEIDGSLS